MADLKKRLLVSTFALAVIAFLITFSNNVLVSALVMLCIASIVGMGVWEYAHLAIVKGLKPKASLMIGVAVAVVFAYYGAARFNFFQLSPLCVLGAGFIVIFLRRFRHVNHSLTTIAVEFFGVCYLAVPLSMMLGILYPHPHMGLEQEGRFWLLYLITVTKIADVAGYFIGRLWGRKSLAPYLSPRKTIEGSIAGFLASVGMSILMQYLGGKWFDGNFALTLPASIVLGVLIGVFSQLGDLAESLLKRDAIVKDSNSLPGIGGILDMVDSLLFTTPILYFFLNMV